MEGLKVRIVGDPRQMEELSEILRNLSKTWGKKKMFRLRKYERVYNEHAKYSRSFGSAKEIYYIKMSVSTSKEKVVDYDN